MRIELLATTLLITTAVSTAADEIYPDESMSFNILTIPGAHSCASVERFVTSSCAETQAFQPGDEISTVAIMVSDVHRFPEGLRGVRFGIQYTPGVELTGWSICNGAGWSLEIGWPASGKSVELTAPGVDYWLPERDSWVLCTLDLAGWTIADSLWITPCSDDPFAVVTTGVVSEAVYGVCESHLGGGALAGPISLICEERCDPDVPITVQSWSRLKTRYY